MTCTWVTRVAPVASAVMIQACARAGPSTTRAPVAAPAGDSAVVAALDEQYQNAVKANDAATMARILADDFVLVTGRGTTFTKEDLLREARAATTTYERQDVE